MASIMPRRLLLLIVCAACVQAGAAANEKFWSLLRQGGNIVLIRHAQTVPGIGDPPGFVLDDCRTQRNLSDAGRADAVRRGRAAQVDGTGTGNAVRASHHPACLVAPGPR